MTLRQKLLEIQKQKSALLAANFYNLETLQGILGAASDLKQPVILQISPGSVEYMGLRTAVGLARTSLRDFQVEGWLHLDHASSIRLIAEAINEGFDSVMIDASNRPFNENAEITSQVVRIAGRTQAVVEAELGYIAKPGESQMSRNYTDPDEAERFVGETGVDMLAVAIGSAHGFYSGEPVLDLDRLREIRKATPVPLVLHGGSGIPDNVIQEAVRCGICKLNVATETKNIFMKTIRKEVQNNEEIDLRIVFPPAIDAVRKLIRSKLEIISGL